MKSNCQSVNYGDQLIQPTKILCVGRNYVAHIEELNNELPDEMVIFAKPNSAIGNQLLSYSDEPLHYESELCYLVEGGEFVAVAFGFDLTKRALQSKLKSKGLPWERSKGFNGAAVFGEFIPLAKIHGSLCLRMYIDGVLTQQGGVDLMIYKPREILKELQTFVDLYDGDIVMTGTPAGVGQLEAGKEYCGSLFAADKLLSKTSWIAQ